MNQSQIEILIKLRTEADQALARLSEGLKRVTGESTAMAGAGDRAGESFDRRLKPAAVATGVVLGNLATMAGQRVYQAFTSTIGAANRLDAALIGLSSVAKHNGVDLDAARQAAIRLASDGLMTVSEAAGGLKNLLSSGLSLDQSVALMDRLKESATFNRQAHYELGAAVVATTEGIKNGNSVLADASGVTKNLSVMLQEAGISSQELGKAQKDGSYQAAIFNGFMRETEGAVGNVSKYLDTGAGKQAQFTAAVMTTQQAIGARLQPVLGKMLDTLTPLVEVIGQNADVVAPLGMAFAAVVGPVVAFNAASSLGIINLLRIGPAAMTASAGVATLSASFSAMLANPVVLTVAAIATGLVVLKGEVDKVREAQDRYNQSISDESILRRAQDGSLAQTKENQEAVIDAYTRTNRLLPESAARLRETIGYLQGFSIASGEAAGAESKRATVAEVSARVAREVQAEIESTGQSLNELARQLKNDEVAFRLWAKEVDLSAEAVKAIEARLKTQTEATAKAARESEAYQDRVKALRESLESLGLIGAAGVRRELALLDEQVAMAKGENIAYASTITALVIPALESLLVKAKLSGIGVDEVTRRLEQARGEASLIAEAANAAVPRLPGVTAFNAEFLKTIGLFETGVEVFSDTRMEAAATARAMEYFGVTSRAELEATARASQAHYAQLLRSGKATPEEIARAFKKMTEDVEAASGRIPSYWESEVAPGVVRALDLMRSAVKGSFAQMLLGAKGFKDGFLDIWQSIKAGAINVFNEIASAYLDKVIRRMMGASQQGATSATAGLAGAIGGGATMIGGMPAQAGLPGVGASGSTLGVLSAGAGVGVSSFLLGRQLTGQYGRVAGAAGGALGGAATGAMIGSVLPGFGTVAGALVGAGAGLLGGIFGQSKGQKEDKSANEDIANLRAELIKTYGSLDRIREIGAQVGVDLAGAFGHQGKRGLDQFLATIDEFKAKSEALDATMREYGVTWKDLGEDAARSKVHESTRALLEQARMLEGAGVAGDTALRRMAPAFNSLLTGILDANQRIPDELAPRLERLAELGLISAENVARLTGNTANALPNWRDMESAARDLGVNTEKLGRAFEQSKMNEQAGDMVAKFDLLAKHTDDYGDLLNNTSDEAQAFYDKAKKYNLEIPDTMRPMLEKMVEAGLLFDENGEKLKDLSGVKFAAPVKSETSQIVDAIRELTDLFRNGLPDAVGAGVRGATQVLRSADWSVDVDVRTRTSAGSGGATIDVPGAANGIFAAAPTFRVFGEREPELGGPVSFMSKALAGALERVPGLALAGGPVAPQVELLSSDVTLDGERVGRAVFRIGIRDGRRRGLIPSR